MKHFFVYDGYGARVGEVFTSLPDLYNSLPDSLKENALYYMVQEVDTKAGSCDNAVSLLDVVSAFEGGEMPEDLDFF